MLLNYKKHYQDISILYCMVLCLDPGVKILGFHNIIKFFYETLDFDANSVATIRQLKIKKYERKNS
jgi:hypothetical protein